MVGLPGAGGLPGHRALHPRFEAHHRPVAEQFHTAWVTIGRHSSDTGWDSAAGQDVFPPPDIVWAGWARVQRQPQAEVPRSIGDRQVVVSLATVTIPADAPEVRIGYEVRVQSYRDPGAGDPHLLDRSLWVRDIYPGSVQWERALAVQDAPPTSRLAGGVMAGAAFDRQSAETIAKLERTLTDAVPGARLRAHQAVRKAAFEVERGAKKRARVKTGALRNSINSTFEESYNDFVAEVGPEVHYGVHLEFGTERMAPRPFLRPAYEEVEPGFIEALRQIGPFDG